MSVLAEGQSYKDEPVKLRIIKKSTDMPEAWWNDHIGETIDANYRTWYQDGKITHQYYIVPKTPGGGFNGSIDKDCVELAQLAKDKE